MAIGRKKAEISKAVETLYRALFDELKFAKQQQWRVTNYLLLVLAAIFGISKALPQPLIVCEKIIGSMLVLAAVAAGFYVLIDLQFYMGRIRVRLEAIEATFSLEDQKLLQVEAYPSPARRGLPFLVILLTALAIAGFLVGYGLWRL